MTSQELKEANSECDERDVSQRWEEIVLSDDKGESTRPSAGRWQDNIKVKTMALSLVKESSQQILDATPDFVVNITSAMMFSLLVYLIFSKNGMSVNDLELFKKLGYLWLTSIIGGYLIRLCQLPPLLGMILASVIATNSSENVQIPETWGETITSSGLAIILLLSGLELDLKGLQKSSKIAMRLTCIPGIVEAIISGLLAVLIFGMPFWLGLSLGFILAAVSPALVVVGMLKLQHKGYGVRKGIPSLIIAAASFDDIVAITGFSFFIGLAIQSDHSSMLYSALHGPVSIIIGVGIGVVGGTLLSITKVWNTPWKRTTVAILYVLCAMFGMKRSSYAGAGAMGSLITGMLASYNWENGMPNVCSKEANKKFSKETEYHVSILWSMIFEPLLFGFIGSALDFDLLHGSLGKSFSILLVGVFFRLIAAYFATGGDSLLSQKERIFISLVWMPKATVQAALCTFPLMLAKDTISPEHTDYDQYILWCNQILSTAILSIIVTAPFGLMFIQYLGPKWLTKDKDSEKEEIKEDKEGIKDNYEKSKDEKINDHISRLDVLLQNISLSSSQVEQTCILAEVRQVLWKCKSKLNMN